MTFVFNALETRRLEKERLKAMYEKQFLEESFKEAISTEIKEQTQKIPKNNKDSLIAFWKSITTLSADGTLTKEQTKEIVIKYMFSEPSASEIQSKLLLAQLSFMKWFKTSPTGHIILTQPIKDEPKHIKGIEAYFE